MVDTCRVMALFMADCIADEIYFVNTLSLDEKRKNKITKKDYEKVSCVKRLGHVIEFSTFLADMISVKYSLCIPYILTA